MTWTWMINNASSAKHAPPVADLVIFAERTERADHPRLFIDNGNFILTSCRWSNFVTKCSNLKFVWLYESTLIENWDDQQCSELATVCSNWLPDSRSFHIWGRKERQRSLIHLPSSPLASGSVSYAFLRITTLPSSALVFFFVPNRNLCN